MTPRFNSSFAPPQGYERIRVVASFEELVNTSFADGVNALCWPRVLPGDFGEVVSRLGQIDEITTLEDEDLRGLVLSPAGRAARDQLIADQRLLRERGLSPILDCIPAYPRDEEAGPVPIDVYSFHADSATAMADTYLCSYNEASSEGLRQEDAIKCIDIPETKAALLKLYGGADGIGFERYLEEHFFDLHYVAKPGEQPFSFGLGNLWRIAIAYPGCPVPPCVHRAPATVPGRPPRLLLIS
jgi:hypothetical protein